MSGFRAFNLILHGNRSEFWNTLASSVDSNGLPVINKKQLWMVETLFVKVKVSFCHFFLLIRTLLRSAFSESDWRGLWVLVPFCDSPAEAILRRFVPRYCCILFCYPLHILPMGGNPAFQWFDVLLKLSAIVLLELSNLSRNVCDTYQSLISCNRKHMVFLIEDRCF